MVTARYPYKDSDGAGVKSLLRPYEALSYTWGSGVKTNCICLNGYACMRVTSNLYSALLDLQLESAKRSLWIDAICINQRNVSERSQQVACMHEIYSAAQRVIVWLGPLSRTVNQSIEDVFLEHAKSDPLYTEKRKYRFEEQDLYPIGNIESLDYEYWHALELYVKELLSASWFERLWVLQEVFSARRVSIHHGRLRHSWSHLVYLVKTVAEAQASDVFASPNCRHTFRLVQDLQRWRQLGSLGHLRLETIKDSTTEYLCKDSRDHVLLFSRSRIRLTKVSSLHPTTI